jgi:DNA-binding CsgD family transcriptional regulator
MNPWNLSAHQEAAIAAMARTGCQKKTADELGISSRSVEGHMQRARDKIGVRNTMLAVLEWDRFARKQEAA